MELVQETQAPVPSEMEEVKDATSPDTEIGPLAKFRAQVAAEKSEARGKMSESAKTKLRAQSEQDRLDDIRF